MIVVRKETLKNRIKYTHNLYGKYHELWFCIDKYSKEELSFVDELFKNLDKDNLAIIKGILHSKTKSKKYHEFKQT